MYLKQLTVFIENRQGRLQQVLDVLKQDDISILSMSLADTSEYGLLRLLVDKPMAGKKAFEAAGYACMISDVLGIKLAHKAGKLQELLAIICAAHINVEYLYALSTGSDDASVVIKISNPEKAVAVLKDTGAELVAPASLQI